MESIVFIRERAGMGITKPFICQLENRQWVVVKTKSMMPIAQLLAEFVGSYLAAKIGLPCPNWRFVRFSKETLAYAAPEWKNVLNADTAFGSDFIANAKLAKTVQAQNTDYFPEPEQKLLYMFDRWILNADRTASDLGTGNINLLFDEQQQKILVIDHNLAFDEQADFSEHLFAPQQRKWHLDKADKQQFTAKAIDLLNHFDDIYQIIPDDWFPLDDEAFHKMEQEIHRIKAILARIHHETYWDSIE